MTYQIQTTEQQDKTIKAWCDVNGTAVETVVAEALKKSIDTLVSTSSIAVSKIVGQKYYDANEQTKAQIDEILQVKPQ